jgi:hypothetical protein
MPIIPALRRLRQEDYVLEESLGYSDTLFQKIIKFTGGEEVQPLTLPFLDDILLHRKRNRVQPGTQYQKGFFLKVGGNLLCSPWSRWAQR